jgi:threonine/homoserine/homoserine lactone efflux protein
MEVLPALLLFTASASFTPGPNNIMIMSSGLNFGIRPSLPHLCGICVGVAVMLMAVGSGAGYLFVRYPYVHEAIKIIGVCYLSYLAWRIATSAPSKQADNVAKPLTFMQAALFQWFNPKALILGTSAIATFTSIGSELSPQIALIVLVFFLMAWPAVATWLLFGAGLQRVLRNPMHQRWFNTAMALLLMVSMYQIIIELAQRYLAWIIQAAVDLVV